MLDNWSRSGRRGDDVQRKARAFLYYLNRYPSELSQRDINYDTLANRISNLHCILYSEKRTPSFPGCLPWYSYPRVLCKPSEVKDASKCLLVGSTMPVVADVTAVVSEIFGLYHDPPVKNVLQQLSIVKDIFHVDNQTDSLIIVKAIYQFMERKSSSIAQTKLKEIKEEVCLKQLIWNGEGFSIPKHTVVKKTSQDMDLRPYFYTIPEEFFAFQQLFYTLDCCRDQTVDVLLNTISSIDRQHQFLRDRLNSSKDLTIIGKLLHRFSASERKQDQINISKDLTLIGKILNRLAERKDELEGKFRNILIPIESEDFDTITLKHVDECVYDKNPQYCTPEEGEERVFIVHESVSIHTAKELGVRSLNRKALSDTEKIGYEAWGQDEPLTTRIHTLLKEGYMDGLSVPKELLQNADDAGATIVNILYDERTNEDAQERLLSRGMKECQGPALWVFNNAEFSREDLINITKLNGATKEKEARKIGKFGLGFCSVYNLTDVPSLVSGTNIVMFDPHMTYLEEALPGNSPGLKIDLSRPKNRILVRRNRDQFKPFEGIFGCDLFGNRFSPFKGTLFRFPLRTFEQSQNSKLSAKFYSRQEVQELLRMFINAAGNFLLFTQNIQEIDLFYLPQGASVKEQKLLFSISRECLKFQSKTLIPIAENVLSRISIEKKKENFTEIQKRNITQNITETAKEVIPNLDCEQATAKSSWIIAWASGTKESLALSKTGDRYAFPLSAIGIPCRETKLFDPIELIEGHTGFYKSGHIFCFLPLPLTTGLPMHVNGSFDVTSDRRHLLSLTEDDKGPRSNKWNNALMKDSLVNAFMCLLITLSQNASSSYIYHSIWPTECESVVTPFKIQFFRRIVTEDIHVFKGKTKWTAFHDVAFLDPKIRECQNIGQIAYDMLNSFTARHAKIFVEMPSKILSALMDNDNDTTQVVKQAIIGEEEMLIVFLKNIQNPFWTMRKIQRDQMIIHALQSNSNIVQNMITETPCVPSEPNGILRKPGELVHPSCDVAGMFLASDGRFPINDKCFRSKLILDKLVGVGMIAKFLPENLLVERCKSIGNIAQICCDCAHTRYVHIMKYLSSCGFEQPLKDTTLTNIKGTHMLPVLTRPKSWAFSWKSDSSLDIKCFQKTIICDYHPKQIRDTIVFGKPEHLYRQTGMDYVGSIANLVDERVYAAATFFNSKNPLINIYRVLGVKGNALSEIPVHQIVKQISILSEEYCDKDNQFEEISRIYRLTFDHLVTRLRPENEDGCVESIQTLHNKPIILIGKALFLPRTVVYNVKEECAPYLNRLPKCEQMDKAKPLYGAIGIRENFAVSDIVDVLKIKKDRWNIEKCGEMDVINKLLLNVEESISKEKKTYKDFENFREFIVGPDIEGFLWPTYELVIADTDFRTRHNMHILHGRIASDLAKGLGAKFKNRKCLQNISHGIRFGQKEKLVTRLKKLLKAYPCDSSIMKELLQNADDANATEIHFIKDYRTHPTPKTLGISDKLQGPALCVFNNSYFKGEDFEGIHNLGEGSKSGDPTKTGQYGVGFNAVYHLTDTPTFMAKGPGLDHGGALCIFDPLCTHIPDVDQDEPGMRYEIDGLRENFPEVLLGFKEIEGLCLSETGTIFRLPLRTEHTVISKEEMSIERLDQILAAFVDDMFEALLFVKKVNCIKISNITSGQLVEEYSFRVVLSKEDRKIRESFFDEVHNIVESNRTDKVANVKVEPIEARYEMKTEDNRGKEKKWFVVQRFGFGPNQSLPEEITHKFRNGELGSLPIGGIAMELSEYCTDNKRTDQHARLGTNQSQDHVRNECSNKSGKAFCFLPLPIETGLPLHVNGHFALDHESRRELWKDGYRNQWNECLLQYTIAPAMVAAVQYLHTSLIDAHLKDITSWHIMHTLMERYHAMFPLCDNAINDFWKCAVRQFYKFVLENEIKLFPIVQSDKKAYDTQNPKQKTTFTISWTPITYSSRTFQGVFNDISKHMATTLHFSANMSYFAVNRQDVYVLQDILKDVGMKLIQTPIEILKTIHKVGFKNIPTANPMFVIQFLKSFEDDHIDSCSIGNVNDTINQTKFRDVKNLKHVVRYIMQENAYYAHIEGLPILLTADLVLRKFTSERPIYHLKFHKLLPDSSSQILHNEFLTTFDQKELYDKGFIRKLGVSDFIILLPDSYSPDQFARQSNILWNKERSSPVSPQWIREVFEFLYEESKDTTLTVNHEKFQKNMQQLNQWSFLPSKQQNGHQTKDELIPIAKSYCLVHRSCVQNAELASVFDKVCLPTLDISVFEGCAYASSLKYAIEKVISSTDKPYELLLCLLHYKDRIAVSNLSREDGLSVLSYFARNINILLEKNDDSLNSKLRSLPLYPTHQRMFVSLEDDDDILVLPDDIPRDGLQVWASSTGITLLKKAEVLEPLYEFLNLSTSNTLDVYINKILPTVNQLPRVSWLAQIRFIRDCLLNSFMGYNKKQKKIISLLKQLRFVDVNGDMKRVDELYNQDHPVFKVMLEETNFPPIAFRTEEWEKLFTELGLKVEPDDHMMIRFAKEVELDSRNGMNASLCEMSDVIVTHFISNVWKANTLTAIKTVRFVVPYQVDTEMKNILRQPDDGSRLVCFETAVSYVHRRLCWTSLSLLPEWVCSMHDNVVRQLGVYDEPPLDKVIIHCQDVCEAFKMQLEREQVSKDFVKRQMEQFYNFFEKHKNETAKIIQRLKHTPFIYIPEETELVMVNEIVIELTNEEEVKPYLFKAPTYYGRFYDFFIRIGTKEKATCLHYASILNTLKAKVKEEELLPPELHITRKAVTNLFTKLRIDQSMSSEIGRLYLPDRQRTLVDSKTLTVSNNDDIEQRIGQHISINYFIGFEELEIDILDQIRQFENFPENVRPEFLTDVVTEQVCTADMIVIEDDRFARHLEYYLQSTEFITGVVRLIKHQLRHSNQQFSDIQLASVVSRLQNVKISKVSGLKTVLKYRDNIVDGSEREKLCTTSPYNDAGIELYTMYFQSKVNDVMDITDLIEEDGGLVDLIQQCADNGITREKYITCILRLIDTPSRIKEKLDELRIDDYDLPLDLKVSAFPRPGTYVKERCYPFLEQGIYPFKLHEYKCVALELEDDEMDNDYNSGDDVYGPVYIYVHIIREEQMPDRRSHLRLQYAIDTGNNDMNSETVPIYRLYRFVRKESEVVSDVVRYDDEPVGAVAFDDNCRRIRQMLIEAWALPEIERRRVIRRLLMKWHPDKNYGNKEYCTRVFNYIKEVIIKLEHNEHIEDTVTNETGRTAPDTSGSSYYGMGCNINRRAHQYARAFRENIGEYNRSQRSGIYAHHSGNRAVRPDLGEANRWLRQAKNDYRAAQVCLPTVKDVDGFNWICYTCHQACEKALKAACFSKDGNCAPRTSHILTLIASNLTPELMEQARLLENRLGEHTRMRYPDSVSRPRIPSDMFKLDDAEFSIKVANKVLKLADEFIQ